MSLHSGLRSIVWAACCCLALVGCNGGGGGSAAPDTNIRTAGGHISINGVPVAGAKVQFFAAGSSGTPSATGVTDEGGNYMLTTEFQDDGAAIGTYDVAIVAGGAEEGEAKPDDGEKSVATPIPDSFAAPVSSGLKAEVTADGQNWFAFDLGAK